MKSWVKYYPEHRKPLLIALAVCIGSFTLSALLYKLTAFDFSFALGLLGIGWMMLTSFILDLKYRDTLLRENVNLVASILHPSSWWGLEDKPIQDEALEPIAA